MAAKKKKKNSVEEEEVKKIVSESQSVRSKQGLEATKSVDSVNCVKDEDKKNEEREKEEDWEQFKGVVKDREGNIFKDWKRMSLWCEQQSVEPFNL